MSPSARRHSAAAAPWCSACARARSCGESRLYCQLGHLGLTGSRGHGVAPRHGIAPRSMSRRASRRGRAPPGKADRRGPLRWPRPPRTRTAAAAIATSTPASFGSVFESRGCARSAPARAGPGGAADARRGVAPGPPRARGARARGLQPRPAMGTPRSACGASAASGCGGKCIRVIAAAAPAAAGGARAARPLLKYFNILQIGGSSFTQEYRTLEHQCIGVPVSIGVLYTLSVKMLTLRAGAFHCRLSKTP